MAATIKPPDVREQLIAGGLRLVSEEGSDDLSVRRLAQSAARTTMCVYTKFGNRRGLVAAIYERAAGALLEDLDASKPTFLALAQAYVDFAAADPATYELLFTQPMTALDLDRSLRTELVAEIVGRFAARGSGPHAQDSARAAWSTMHGLASLHQLDETPRSQRREDTERAVAVLLRGESTYSPGDEDMTTDQAMSRTRAKKECTNTP